MTSPYIGSPLPCNHPRYSRSRPSGGASATRRARADTRYTPAVTWLPWEPPIAVTFPSAPRVTQSGFSSATRGVTASTVASSGRAAACRANRAKSSGAHHASTVESSIDPAGPRAVTSRKLSRDEAVVFTMNSMSSSG
jgi:hypothetical protein